MTKSKLRALLVVATTAISLMVGCASGPSATRSVADIDDHGGDHGRDDHGRDDHGGFGHAPVHVHDSVSFHRGQRPGGWRHWDHPGVNHVVYDFNWFHLRAVTCTAQDQYGEQFPITEDSYRGAEWQQNINVIEDNSIDYCYNTSSAPTSCYLVGCSPAY